MAGVARFGSPGSGSEDLTVALRTDPLRTRLSRAGREPCRVGHHSIDMPLLSLADAVAWADRLHAEGKTIVFTNGVFDLLHPGHVRYLADARAQGGALIVAVNSDRSVRAIKGPARPINSEQERAEILAALAAVDAVVIFDEDDPYAIISAIQPDILVKGADWAADRIIGRDVVEARGGRVVRIDFATGFSTTSMIEKIRRGR
jgi:D-glycero-beta-D-manno-heptose 1-phosphate adenylyltransferase